MIYLNVFLRVFKKFLKVVRGGGNGVKWGKMEVKSLSQNPHKYTTDVSLIFSQTTIFKLYKVKEFEGNNFKFDENGRMFS